MKISPQQILASAGGAVVAAVIASFFGVSGTIIGVAVGSVVATTASAVVAESIDRGHRAVRQAAVHLPAGTAILRRSGATSPVGRVSREGEPAGGSAVGEQSVRIEPRARRRWPWRRFAVAAVAAFAVALVVVTLVELGAGKPLSALVGSHPGGGSAPSVGEVFGAGSAPATTTTVPGTTTTTTTMPGTTTTTTTGPPEGTPTTTAPPAASTVPTTVPTTAPPGSDQSPPPSSPPPSSSSLPPAAAGADAS